MFLETLVTDVHTEPQNGWSVIPLAAECGMAISNNQSIQQPAQGSSIAQDLIFVVRRSPNDNKLSVCSLTTRLQITVNTMARTINAPNSLFCNNSSNLFVGSNILSENVHFGGKLSLCNSEKAQ
jgi:hypothetical protein